MIWFETFYLYSYTIFQGERGDDGAIGFDGDVGVPGLKGFQGPIGPEGKQTAFTKKNSWFSSHSNKYSEKIVFYFFNQYKKKKWLLSTRTQTNKIMIIINY